MSRPFCIFSVPSNNEDEIKELRRRIPDVVLQYLDKLPKNIQAAVEQLARHAYFTHTTMHGFEPSKISLMVQVGEHGPQVDLALMLLGVQKLEEESGVEKGPQIFTSLKLPPSSLPSAVSTYRVTGLGLANTAPDDSAAATQRRPN